MKDYEDVLERLGLADLETGSLEVFSPIDGKRLAQLAQSKPKDMDKIIEKSVTAFKAWRRTPAPVRGELIRLFGAELRATKNDLGQLVTIEMGKILTEGLGEVQEMIDICDFAVGLSRQLYGKTIASERPEHHMRESWHPIGPVGVISAFNFPVAVWAWNAALALVCGDSIIWKPSEKTPLTALACQKLLEKAAEKFKEAGHEMPDGLSQVLIGDAEIGKTMVARPEIPLISATGSTRMGKAVALTVAERLGRSLLELGGNNAMIVTPSADLEMAVRAILFSAVGTCGQRCTTLRRLIVHEDIYDKLMKPLLKAYGKVKIGNPLDEGVLVGPLVGEDAWLQMEKAVAQAQKEGGKVLTGGQRLKAADFTGGVYVEPCVIEMPRQSDVMKQETFAPILYVIKYKDFDDAIALNNDVPQGLSSCVFTGDARKAEKFVSAVGSDCGIANVNIGPSGAEIGGAFGGEKETGGGRESGSGAWKAYMRRQTQTVNYSRALPLAQGLKFDV